MILLVCGLALAAVASLPVIGLLVWAVFSPASPDACYQDASATAPDDWYVATVKTCHSTMYIGGTSSWKEVDLCASSPGGQCRKVYAANNDRPAVAWTDARNLTITVDGGGSTQVASSVHSALDVAVSYAIVGQVSEEDFRRTLENTERRLAMQLSPESLREWSQGYWKSFHAFQAWAQANTGHAR